MTDELTESEMGDISSIEERLQQLDVDDDIRRTYAAHARVGAGPRRPHTAQTMEDAYHEYLQHCKRPQSAASSVVSVNVSIPHWEFSVHRCWHFLRLSRISQ